MRLWRILLDPKGDEAGTTTETKTAETKVEAKGPDLTRAAEGLVAKHGDPTAALLVLLGENYALRDKARELGAKVPGEGDRVLKGDQAKDWEGYQALGKPSDLRKAIEDGQRHATEATTLRKAETNRTVAEVMGYKPTVLATLVERDKLDVAVVDDTDKDGKPVKDKDGKTARVAVIKGEGDKVTRLADHAKAHWGDFLPSLATTPAPKPIGTPRMGGGQGHGGKGNTNHGEAPKRVLPGF